MKSQGLITRLALAGMMAALPPLVAGHGYMVEPPSRMSAWKVLSDYKVEPINYDHMAMYCGGLDVQWKTNGGKCGVCGDIWDSNPRDHEMPGGKYVATRPPVNKVYAEGQVIQVALVITAPHKGNFVFRLCKRDSLSTPDATEECLNQTLLLVEGCRDTYSSDSLSGNCKGLYRVNVKLPDDLTCEKCFFQWKYNTGHNYGTLSLEEFYACADIVIRKNVTVTPPPNLEGFQAREGVQSCGLNDVAPCQASDATASTTLPVPTTGGLTTAATPTTTAATALTSSTSSLSSSSVATASSTAQKPVYTTASSVTPSTARPTTSTSRLTSTKTTATTTSTPRGTTPTTIISTHSSSTSPPAAATTTAAAATAAATSTATSPSSTRLSTGDWDEAMKQRCEGRNTLCAEFCSRGSMKLYCYFLSSCPGCYEYFLDKGLMRT